MPLLLTTAFDEVGLAFDYVFFAGCALAVYFPLAAVVCAILRWGQSRLPADCCHADRARQIAAVLVAKVARSRAPLPRAASRSAQSSRQLPLKNDQRPWRFRRTRSSFPTIPRSRASERRPRRFWFLMPNTSSCGTRLIPDKRIDATPPPVGYAIAGTTYEATLRPAIFCRSSGGWRSKSIATSPSPCRWHLAGGVLERATVDGQAARLQLVEPQTSSPTARASGSQGKVSRPRRGFSFSTSPAKAARRSSFTVRLGLSRQGGWRIVRGQIPRRSRGGSDTRSRPRPARKFAKPAWPTGATFETKLAGEKIESALGSDGQHRSAVAAESCAKEWSIRRSPPARSSAFDVREDSLRMAWQVRLDFGRAYRDAFSFTAPADYLVESVTGDNIRGWTVKPLANRSGST